MAEDLTYRLFGQDVSASRAMHGVGDAADKTGSKVEGFGSKASGALGKVGSIAGTAIAGAAVGAVVGLGAAMVGGVQAAISYETLANKTAAVLKSTGNAAGTSVQGIQDLAASLESMSGVDEELIINGENVLATFTSVQNKAGEGNDIFDQATKTALDMSVALGSDLQGANIQLGKALNDPIKGISALSKVGVSFTEQQKAQIATLVKSGDTLGAQKVILAELTKEFGGTAKAAGEGTAGSFARLQDAGGDLMRTLGQKLLPTLTDGAKGLTGFISSLSDVETPAGEFVAVLTDLNANIGDDDDDVARLAYNIRTTLVGAFNFLSGIVRAVITWWRDNLEPALRRVAEQLLPKLRSMFTSVGQTIREHKDILTFLKQAFAVFSTVLTQYVIPGLGKVAGIIIDSVGPAFKVLAWNFSNIVIPGIKFMANAFMTAMGIIVNGAASAFGWIPGIGPKLQAQAASFNKFRDTVNAALAGIQDEDVVVHVRVAGAAALAQYSNNSKLQMLEKRARGGPTSANKAYLIGEEGPEIFVPSGNGHVIPNDKLLGAARSGAAIVPGQRGGGDVYLTVNGYVGNEAQLVKVIRSAGFSVKGRGLGYGLT